MELEELIENTLRRKHLEEMMNRPEKEHTPLEGMEEVSEFLDKLLAQEKYEGRRESNVKYVVE